MLKVFVFLATVTGCLLADSSTQGDNQKIKEQHFEKHKQLEERSHTERINIISKSQDCIRDASNGDELKNCNEREREALKAHKDKMQDKIEEFKRKRDERRMEKVGNTTNSGD